jgi:phosphoribosyl-dephospho-CoA transferase
MSFFSHRIVAIYDLLSENESTTRQSPRQASVRERRIGIVSMSFTAPGGLERTEKEAAV